MRLFIVLCFGVVPLGFVAAEGAGGQPAPKQAGPVRAEVGRLQGTWRVVAVELGGKELGRGEFGPDNLLDFADDTCAVLTGKQRPIDCTFTIDPTKSPKWIDMTRTSDGVSWEGIYELKGDTLKIFLGGPGKRPKEFKTKEGTSQVIHTHERVKP
jgi:uncharacterized protein (TIGR03067 family)